MTKLHFILKLATTFRSKITWQIHIKDLKSNTKCASWCNKQDTTWLTLELVPKLFAPPALCACVLPENQQLEDTPVDGKNNQLPFAWSVLWKFYQKTKQLKNHLYLYTRRKWKLRHKRCWAADSGKSCKGPVRVNQAQWGWTRPSEGELRLHSPQGTTGYCAPCTVTQRQRHWRSPQLSKETNALPAGAPLKHSQEKIGKEHRTSGWIYMGQEL